MPAPRDHRTRSPERPVVRVCAELVTVVGHPTPPPRAVRRRADDTLDSARSCGACRVCCRLPDIPELSKPLNTWCRHCDTESARDPCRIYEHRPQVCRAFDCAWKQGLGSDLDRPDILGVMWQIVTLPDGGPGLGVVEARRGALDTPRIRQQLREFEARKPGRIIVRRAHEPRFSPVAMLIEGKPPRPSVHTRPNG